MNTPISQPTLGDILPYFITIGILLLFMIFAIFMVIKTSKEKKKFKLEHQELMKEKGATHYITLFHTSGLQLPENTLCEVFSCADNIEINANGIQFKLNKVKIHDITFNTDVEIQKQYVSSAAGAVGGAILFGAVGALIGGRVKKKKNRIIHSYMIISYSKNDSIDYIAFDVTNNLFQARKFIDEFKATNNITPKSVEL